MSYSAILNCGNEVYFFYTSIKFVELRDVALARLIIWHGHSNDKPSSLSRTHWETGKNNKLVDQDKFTFFR